jgi:hypothetical protein
MPNLIAFWTTAPGDRLSFFAVSGPDNRPFANARRFFTSSFDHATNRFAFAIIPSSEKGKYHNAAWDCVNQHTSCFPIPRTAT